MAAMTSVFSSKGDVAYAELRHRILSGSLAPGSKLDQYELADDMSMSITPVREAIFRLVTERALEMRAATSIHVRRLTADELREIQLIRHLLEGEAAAQAARNITPDALRDLERLQVDFTTAAANNPLQA